MLGFGRRSWCALLAAGFWATAAHAAEHVTLKNGSELICDHSEAVGASVRLYVDAAGSNYYEVKASDIASSEHIDLPKPVLTEAAKPAALPPVPEKLTDADLQPILKKAESAHNIDADLLASVVRAESAGHTRAVSRAGAQGLMQLMPGTASDLGVGDSFAPSENIQGGSAYLDWLLTRYHDDLNKALAAYNAGPGVVDRCNCVPRYRETQLYIARVIREYNRRVLARRQADLRAAATR